MPVAHVYALCEDPEVIGSAFYVMDYVEGRIFWDALLPEVAPPERRAIYSEMVRVLAALHSVDYTAVGLGDFGKPGQLRRAAGRALDAAISSLGDRKNRCDGAADRMAAASTFPPTNRPPSCTATFVSITPFFIPREPRILAVLDWELSTLGHPLVDFAYYCMRFHLSGRRSFAASAEWMPSAHSIPTRSRMRGASTAGLRGIAPVPPQGLDLLLRPSACSAWPEFCRACWRGPCRAMPRAPRRCRRAAEPVRLAELGWKLVQQSFDV